VLPIYFVSPSFLTAMRSAFPLHIFASCLDRFPYSSWQTSYCLEAYRVFPVLPFCSRLQTAPKRIVLLRSHCSSNEKLMTAALSPPWSPPEDSYRVTRCAFERCIFSGKFCQSPFLLERGNPFFLNLTLDLYSRIKLEMCFLSIESSFGQPDAEERAYVSETIPFFSYGTEGT